MYYEAEKSIIIIALMDNLRSKSHLYNVIQAIRVVSFGPVSIFFFLIELIRAIKLIDNIYVYVFRSQLLY